MPPTACTPNASSASSYKSMASFRRVEAKNVVTPATAPMHSAPSIPAVPLAGVIPTRPAMAPLMRPSVEGRPKEMRSVADHASCGRIAAPRVNAWLHAAQR